MADGQTIEQNEQKPRRRPGAAERRENRDEACRRIAEIERMAFRVIANDDRGTHFTVWVTPSWRVEWWPGTGQWASGHKGADVDCFGNFQSFKGFVRNRTDRRKSRATGRPMPPPPGAGAC